MAYTKRLRELIRKVEATRAQRIRDAKAGKHFPFMSDKEKEEVLNRFHPDYIKGAKRVLKVGPNKGDKVPNEVADLLETRSRLDIKDVNLANINYDVDVLIIGGGGAGAAAALMAYQNGANVLITTKLRLGDSNTMMAEGGIQAADKPHDSPVIHYLDTIGGGHFTNVPELVETLTRDAPSAIQWLENLGVMFDKEADGTMKVLHGGGTSRKRMHSAGDMTGAAIMQVLRDEIRNHPEIKVIEFSPAVELILDSNGACAGAVLYNLETGEYLVARAKSTIITTGGFGRVHIQGYPTTNHYGATADGIVMAYRAGAPFCFLEYSQFHPTGAVFPEQNVGLLITEKMRGAGAQLLNIEGEQFVYPLEPRDVESSAIIRECTERKKGVVTPTERMGVWLDTPMIDILRGKGYIQENFPAKYRQFMRHNIDISKEPILVFPTLHYQNGGIKINRDAETLIPNLFAAGEVTGGVHGTNRLMGNSLLDIIVFGRRAGVNAVKNAKKSKLGKLSLAHIKKYNQMVEQAKIKARKPSPILLPDYRWKVG